MPKKIALTRGYFAVVDDEDYHLVADKKWTAVVYNRCHRVYATHYFRDDGGKVRAIAMHRLLVKVAPGMVVDHINGDALDNRRENLRICTTAENLRNRKPHKRFKNPHIKYKGVCPYGEKFAAKICIDKKQRTIGVFDTQIAAARAYDAEAKRLHGNFARVNFGDCK
jgi:hypothetical protein